MLRSVMVPTDFTDESSLILRFVPGLAELGTRRVVLGHVVEASGMEGPIIAAMVDRAREQIRQMAAPLAEAGLDVEVRVGAGDPAQGLIGIAHETHVNAMVCGTHGKGLLTKLFAGSVSEQIALEANVPVMLVRFDLLRTKDDPAQVARSFGRSLILPTDFSSSSTRALLGVLDLPPRALGTVYLVHAADEGLDPDKLAKAQTGAEFHLGNLRAMAEEHGVVARCVIREGDPTRTVLREANERRATGIVVGTRGRNLLQEAVLGSTSMTLMRQASCPVMIVP